MKQSTDIKGILIGCSILIGVLAVIVIVVVLLKRKTMTKVRVPQDVVGKGISDADAAIISQLAKNLYTDMKGLNVFNHDESIYENVSKLSDTQLAYLNNYFNSEYGNGDSLRQWLQDEWFGWSDIKLKGLVSGIIERLTKLENN